MNDIQKIYTNSFGISFKWEKESVKHKTQLVFRDTGMLLSDKELYEFEKQVKIVMSSSLACKGCIQQNACKSILLETPTPQISFAVNFEELESINDLIKGTIFNLGLENILNNLEIKKTTEE